MEPGLAASILGKCELFASLDQDELEGLARGSVDVSLTRGERVYEVGEPAESAYVVASGNIRFVLGSGTNETTLGVVGPGESFGEIALLDGGPRGASAEALEDSVVIGIPRTAVLRMLITHEGYAEELLATIGHVVRRIGGDVVECLFLDLEGRVARLLLELAGARDEPRDGDVVDLSWSQRKVASMVHGSRQRVNHVLAALEASGYIRREPAAIVLTDVDGLRHRSEI
jgi:CRP/FNR family transcriptional regulator, cyclic AMP receptor protein